MTFLRRSFVYSLTAVFSLARRLAELRQLPPLQDDKPALTILATGTFYSDNWILTHLVPLAGADCVARVVFVSVRKAPDIEGVEQLTPAAWLTRLVGATLSRQLVFCRAAIRIRPDIVLGFHLLLNGMLAQIFARLVRARSVYVCGGGKREFEGGGYATENRIYRNLKYPSRYVEKKLLYFVRGFDLNVVMGRSVKAYLEQEVRVNGHIAINPGGCNRQVFYPSSEDAEFDLILVGRLSEVKRVDRFLQLVADLQKDVPGTTAVIVGDGPARQDLENLARDMGMESVVTFAGWQSDVSSWLRRSRIFCLTSSSEGLSQALMQAQMCGLPALVPDVGDLGDCAHDGRNGFLLPPGNMAALHEAAVHILTNDDVYADFSAGALATGALYTYEAAAETWHQSLLTACAMRNSRTTVSHA